jgi:hypothetical protein
MYLHANAKLGLAGRLALVRAIEDGLSLKAAARKRHPLRRLGLSRHGVLYVRPVRRTTHHPLTTPRQIRIESGIAGRAPACPADGRKVRSRPDQWAARPEGQPRAPGTPARAVVGGRSEDSSFPHKTA